MAENKLADLSMNFSIKILKVIENIKGHHSFKTNWNEVRHLLELISEKQNMHIAKPIL